MHKFPEGYTPLDSIPLPQLPEIKWYILPGFSTFEMAKSKVEDLIGKSGVVTYEIHQQQDSYVILLPHTVVQYLTESEREKLIRNYRIRSDVNHPVVWRLMSKKHVEEFFKTGELQISTYAKFAQNDSLIRKDDDEGNVTLHSAEGSLTSKMAIGVGANALVLCTSLSQNNVFSDGTTYDACIEINDLLSFIKTVTLRLAEMVSITGVVHGACMYQNKEIYGESKSKALSNILEQTSSGNSFDFSLLTRLAEETGGNKVYFSKPMEKQQECEYRIVWLTEQEQRDSIIIKVPEATTYCRPIYFEPSKE